MLKAAELALFDSDNRDILLMTADEGADAAEAAAAATRSFWTRAPKIIVGPLFGPSVSGGGAASRATAACRCWPSPPIRAWRAMASIC